MASFWCADRSLSLGGFRTLEFLSKAKSVKLPDNCPKIAVLLLEPALLLRGKPFEMMEKYPEENGAFRMMRTADSRSSGNKELRIGPRTEVHQKIRVEYENDFDIRVALIS